MTHQAITADDHMKIVWKRVAAGQWLETVHHLRVMAAEDKRADTTAAPSWPTSTKPSDRSRGNEEQDSRRTHRD